MRSAYRSANPSQSDFPGIRFIGGINRAGCVEWANYRPLSGFDNDILGNGLVGGYR